MGGSSGSLLFQVRRINCDNPSIKQQLMSHLSHKNLSKAQTIFPGNGESGPGITAGWGGGGGPQRLHDSDAAAVRRIGSVH